MAEEVNGKHIALVSNENVKEKIKGLVSPGGAPLRLVSITIGRSDEAKIYVAMQKRAADFVGIEFSTVELEKDISREALAEEIERLNCDPAVTAVILQKPVPAQIDHDKAVAAIMPVKDAEGIHPYNLGRILRREADIVPCTPGAVMKILSSIDSDLYGKEVVIIGHSAIVGKPLSLMMLNEMATTTVCHIATSEKGDIKCHTQRADILIVAVGKAALIKEDWVKQGAVVIDVGINKVNGGIVGDVDLAGVSKKASFITPVPGGVGPVTVSILMRNVMRAYMDQNA